MNNLANMTSSLVVLPFVVIAAIFFFMWFRGRQQVSAAKEWSTVSGKVIYATVETRRSRSGRSGSSRSHYPKVVYEYTANGQRYQSDKISFGSQVGYGSYNHVLQKVANYPIDSVVQVYYNPNNPAEAVLEKTSPSGKIFLFVAVLMIVILAFTMAFRLGGISLISNMIGK